MQEERLELISKLVHFFKPTTGFHLVAESKVPAGAGLGGSSALAIACIGALNRLVGNRYDERKFVTIAANVESTVIKVPAGFQDYYPPLLDRFRAFISVRMELSARLLTSIQRSSNDASRSATRANRDFQELTTGKFTSDTSMATRRCLSCLKVFVILRAICVKRCWLTIGKELRHDDEAGLSESEASRADDHYAADGHAG